VAVVIGGTAASNGFGPAAWSAAPDTSRANSPSPAGSAVDGSAAAPFSAEGERTTTVNGVARACMDMISIGLSASFGPESQ
jgi:hypothetical protein